MTKTRFVTTSSVGHSNNTEFTLGHQVAGDGPETVKIADNDGVTAVRSPAMCELGKWS